MVLRLFYVCFLAIIGGLGVYQYIQNEESTVVNVESLRNTYGCFHYENGFWVDDATDTIVNITSKGVKLIDVAITDTTFVSKLVKNNIEYTLDTLPCNSWGIMFYVNKWEGDWFYMVSSKGGSDVWFSKFFNFSEKSEIIEGQFYSINKETMQGVLISENNFIVVDFRNGEKIEVPIKNHECIHGFIPFFIDNIQVNSNELKYNVQCKDGNTIETTVEW